MIKQLIKRSYESELLDADNIPSHDLHENLKEIAFVNRHLGGNQITLAGIKRLLDDKNKEYHIIDIGCGAGDNLKAIHNWGLHNGYTLKLYGLDIKAEAIEYAKKNTEGLGITYFIDSYENLSYLPQRFDIATCCLFCHHFTEKDLAKLFSVLDQKCSLGFVINDLHRHWVAYYFIHWMGKLFSKSYLFRNDAPLSVARSFKRKELELLFKEHRPFTIQWRWAFRWLVIKQSSEMAKIKR